ncbi:diguanylate cyclase domain-containing protein [Aeromonas sp. 74A]
MNLHHFREIDNRFGIRIPTRLLSQVAKRLQQLVPPRSLLCRVAADDFSLLCRTSTSHSGVEPASAAAVDEEYQVKSSHTEIPAFLGLAQGRASDAERLLVVPRLRWRRANGSSGCSPC